ncbi:serine hydrolase [Actinoplanes sp. CA-015351]|uniref:serine hydrolase n=1 Tax=Actinoplanes sp. CA-015351 TaxID=3239897 RepID=UPI003D96E79E
MRRLLIPVVAAGVMIGGGGLIYSGLGSGSSPSVTAFVSPSPTGPSPEELAAAERAARVKKLDAALTKVAASSPEFSVAVLDAKTGETYQYRGSEKFDTASIVKADILACMLLKAQDADREPSSRELSLAKPMIRLSDNNATTSLFQRIGGKAAVTQCNKRLGLTKTAIDVHWGLTRTTAGDQVKLLTQLDDEEGPLDDESRETALDLMTTVDEAQDWGVPVIAKAGETASVKNGWDTRTADGGKWVVNSIGRITSDEVDVSVAVLSHDNASQESGIKLVEKVAKMTRQYLKY